MNSKLIILVLLFLLSFFGCRETSSGNIEAQPSINAEAVFIGTQEAGVAQVLLRLELKNHQGDLLKFGITDVPDHQQRLGYYQLQFKHDIFLVNQGDTLTCLDSHLERINMDAPYRNFILSFQSPRALASPELMIYETQFTNKLLQLKILPYEQR